MNTDDISVIIQWSPSLQRRTASSESVSKREREREEARSNKCVRHIFQIYRISLRKMCVGRLIPHQKKNERTNRIIDVPIGSGSFVANSHVNIITMNVDAKNKAQPNKCHVIDFTTKANSALISYSTCKSDSLRLNGEHSE